MQGTATNRTPQPRRGGTARRAPDQQLPGDPASRNETARNHCNVSRKSGRCLAYARAMVPGLLAAVMTFGGCSIVNRLGGGAGATEGPDAASVARSALAAGDLEAADSAIQSALALEATRTKSTKTGTQADEAATAALHVLRMELRVRQGRYPEAESDALTAMALVPATLSPAARAATAPPAADGGRPQDSAKPAAPPHAALDQRGIHLRLANLYEDDGHDDWAEHHLIAGHKLCVSDPDLTERRDCELERDALIRIRMARGEYIRAEPLVLGEIADVQSRYGADDLLLSLALCHASEFYARQGKYWLSSPLYARSLQIWQGSHEDAAAEYKRARAAGERTPFDGSTLVPRAGNAPFSIPCGLQDQPAIFYKLGMAGVAADAIRYEQQLWAGETEAGAAAVAYVDALTARGADPLDIASARHAVAFAAQRKGDLNRAELELRKVVETYAAAWPTLPVSERRYRSADYLRSLESLIELLRSSRRFAEATDFGTGAMQVADSAVNAYDSLRLDTLLSEAKTFREMRDAERAEAAAARYLEAIVQARGDTSADYAWALRTLSFAYLLREEIDASQRMEMQAQAIWAKHSVAAPAF